MPRRALQAALHLACATPALILAWRAFSGTLGAEPVEALLHGTGDWALRLLLATLAVGPLRRWTGAAWLIRWRRPLGLWAFAYASAHALVYVGLDQFFDWGELLRDVAEHPQITLGMATWLLLLPLAATSTRAAQRRLGRRWGRLHRLVYPAAVLAPAHFLLTVKADFLEPGLYLAAALGLLALRRDKILPARE